MNQPLQLGPIGQIAREVRDTAKAEAWYRDVLGLTHLYTFGPLAFFDCGGTRLFLSQPEAGGEPGSQACIYFRVADIQAATAALQAKGVVFRDLPHLIFKHPSGMEEWMAFFDDLDGNLLALMAQIWPS